MAERKSRKTKAAAPSVLENQSVAADVQPAAEFGAPETLVATVTIVREEELEPQTESAGEPEVIDAKGSDDDLGD